MCSARDKMEVTARRYIGCLRTGRKGVSRRAFVAFAIATPVMFTIAGSPLQRKTRLVVRGGWVLRADDLERLDIA